MAFDPDFGGCILLSAVAAAIFILIYLLRRGNKWKYVFGTVLAVYLIFAASYTICPIYFYGSMRQDFIESGWRLRDCIHPVPFSDGISSDDFLNVVLTFPLGFLLPLVSRRFTWRHAAAAGLTFGFGVELIQLLTAALQGFTFKYVDASDLICNFLGTMLGRLAAAGILLLIRRKSKRSKHGSLLGYIVGREVI